MYYSKLLFLLPIESMQTIDEIHDLNDSINVVQFSPNGASLAVATKSGIIHLYQVTNEARKYNRIGRCTVSIKIIIQLYRLEMAPLLSKHYLNWVILTGQNLT